METIKLSKEDIEFLKELQHELNTQTNDGNADPVYWGVLEKQHTRAAEGEGEPFIYEPDYAETYSLDDFIEHIEEDGDKDEELWDMVDKSDVDQVVEFYNNTRGYHRYDGAYVIWLEEEDVLNYRTTGAFLTKRACKEYIQKYGYNHNQPRTFAMTAYRNYELERLLKILKTMKFEEEEETGISELKRGHLISILRGTEPVSAEAMMVIPEDVGYMVGGMGQHWEWVIDTSSKYTNEEIKGFYQLCKMSSKEVRENL